MSLIGKVDQFNLEFEYEEQSSLLDKFSSHYLKKYTSKFPNYTIIESKKYNVLEKEDTFKFKLENSIKNFINENINKLPFETDDMQNMTDLIGFDYKAIPSRLEDIEKIETVKIIDMHIIYDTELKEYVLNLNINTWYTNKNNKTLRLLPVTPYTKLPITISDNKKVENKKESRSVLL